MRFIFACFELFCIWHCVWPFCRSRPKSRRPVGILRPMLLRVLNSFPKELAQLLVGLRRLWESLP